MRVLIADDDATSRRMLELVLGRLGYEVVTTVNGEAALEVLTSDDPPDMAILDWMMPRKNGDEVTREARKTLLGRYVYIILLTSKTSTQDLVKGLDAGADDYLSKPFNVNELQARLRCGERIVELQQELGVARHELQRLKAIYETAEAVHEARPEPTRKPAPPPPPIRRSLVTA